jgi:oligopeptide/dipeptide ABC transporter ATP-binding protein
VLNIKNLKVSFKTDKGSLKAVDNLNLTINSKEIVGLVGESGCGKTITSLSALNLLPSSAIIGGEIFWKNNDVFKMSSSELRAIRGAQISMIFQNPVASLNPVFTVGKQVMDVIRLHNNVSKEKAREETLRLFDLVRIPDAESRIDDYPHQFSGGMCQRIMIAMAISVKPDLLIADEPTASLDVTIQAQIIELLMDLKKKLGMSILVISHDLGVISNMCDRIAIMYLGRVVEEGKTEDVFSKTKHPYTKALLNSVPVPDPSAKQNIEILTGDVPSPINLPKGCYFVSRCKYKKEVCEMTYPEIKTFDKNHLVSCHFSIND